MKQTRKAINLFLAVHVLKHRNSSLAKTTSNLTRNCDTTIQIT